MPDVVMPDRSEVPPPRDRLGLIVRREPTVDLQMTGDRIALEVTAGDTPPTLLEVGSFQRLLQVIAHEPATAGELENAIAEIEEMLMPVIRMLPKRGNLVTSASVFCALPQVVGRAGADQTPLEIATVEEVFGRLAALAYGTPA